MRLWDWRWSINRPGSNSGCIGVHTVKQRVCACGHHELFMETILSRSSSQKASLLDSSLSIWPISTAWGPIWLKVLECETIWARRTEWSQEAEKAGAVVAFELPCLNIHLAVDGVKAIGSCPDPRLRSCYLHVAQKYTSISSKPWIVKIIAASSGGEACEHLPQMLLRLCYSEFWILLRCYHTPYVDSSQDDRDGHFGKSDWVE